MSKKIMKRSLALGALMAFVITGSAWAASATITSSIENGTGTLTIESDKADNIPAIQAKGTDVKISGYDAVVLDGEWASYGENMKPKDRNIFFVNAKENEDKTVTKGKLTIGTQEKIVDIIDNTHFSFDSNGWGSIVFHADNGDMTIYADEIKVSGFTNAIYLQNDSKMDVNANEIVFETTGTYTVIGIGSYSGDVGGSKLNITTDSLEIDAPNATALSVSEGNYGGSIGESVEGNINITADTVDISAKTGIKVYKGASNADKAGVTIDAGTVQINSSSYGIYAEDNAMVNVTATDGLTVTSDLAAYAKGNDVNVSLDGGTQTTINGSVALAGDGTSNTSINLYGKDVVVNASESRSFAIFVKGNANKTNRMTVGNADTGNIAINGGYEDGLFINNGAVVDVTAKDSIKVTGGEYGLRVQGQNQGAEVNLEANDIDVTGMIATGGATINFDGDTHITAVEGISAIDIRGGATINLNDDGNGNSLGNIVKIDGDIDFTTGSDSGDSTIDANVNLILDQSESYLNGNITKTTSYLDKNGNTVELSEDKTKVDGMNLTLSNGAQWNVKGESFVNTLQGDGGIINVEIVDENGLITIDTDSSANLTVNGTGAIADDIANGKTDLQKLANTVKTGNVSAADVVTTAEGEIAGAYSATLTNGVIDADSVTEATNTVNDSIGEASVALKAHWRAHMNDMNKRMGELRNANGEHGVWTRMVRGESEYEGVKAQYNQYQLGYDEKLSVDKRWTVGAAVTFSEGDSSFGKGSTEDDSTALAIYGSKLNNDGTFVDLIARYARLESDITMGNATSDYSTNGMSVSAEFGKRIQQGNGLWIEPQVELTYGTVDSADYVIDGKKVQVGDMDSIIGRVGFSLGKDIKQGNVYARASYLYDFDGETETSFSKDGLSRTIEEDLGGGWWEVGVGANINLSKATYIYADVEKTFGGEVDTNWQWNLGVRYSF